MFDSFKIIQELFSAWQLAISLLVLQLLGGGLFLAFGIPAASDVPASFLYVEQFWCGAAFGTPVGFIIGVLWQRIASSPIPKTVFKICAVGSILLPVVAITKIFGS